MDLENIYHISFDHSENYPFIIGEIYEFKYKNECIISMFQGISKINGFYMFIVDITNLSNGMGYFSYNNIFMDKVQLSAPLPNSYNEVESNLESIKNDKLGFVLKYREYKIDDILS